MWMEFLFSYLVTPCIMLPVVLLNMYFANKNTHFGSADFGIVTLGKHIQQTELSNCLGLRRGWGYDLFTDFTTCMQDSGNICDGFYMLLNNTCINKNKK